MICGADLSIAKTGLALADGTLLTIVPARGVKGYRRLRPMAQAVMERLHHATLVIIEGYDPHPLGALALIRAAELGGIVRAGLLELDIRWVDVPPSTLKKYATGKGNANKDAMLAAARAAGANPSTDDEADAYWLRCIGIELEASLLTKDLNPTLEKVAIDLAQPPPPRV